MRIAKRDCRARSRPSFTLVELLVVISIIGILIGMVLYTLAGAQRDSLVAKTQGTLRKLNDIMLYRWEEFRYRSVKINIPPQFLEPFQVNNGFQTPLSGREGARIRMMILRDTMRMEFPDRYTDILHPPSQYKAAMRTADNVAPMNNTQNDVELFADREVPGVYNNFRKRMVVNSSGAPYPLPSPYLGIASVAQDGVLRSGITLANQGAELLYQIVATANYNGTNGLEYFAPSEIGDTDEDGMPEFIDAWGQPIRWLRWPVGYGMVNATLSSPPLANQREIDNSRPTDWQLNDTSVPDPLDPLRTDWRWLLPKFTQKPWMLVPLIISPGPDGIFDIQFDSTSVVAYATDVWPGPTDSPAHLNSNYYFVDPYRGFYNNTSGAAMQGGLGQWFDEDGSPGTYGAADNITNYGLLLQ